MTSRKTRHFFAVSVLFLNRQNLQFLAGVGEWLEAFLGEDPAVFDPDAGKARDVDPWFNGEAHAFLQNNIVAVSNGREFVDFHPDPVAQAVDEVFTVAGISDDLAGNAVKFASGHA